MYCRAYCTTPQAMRPPASPLLTRLVCLLAHTAQVSDKERKVELDTLFRDVASVLSEKCMNPESNRPCEGLG